jgi:hypothetical protein
MVPENVRNANHVLASEAIPVPDRMALLKNWAVQTGVTL